MKFVLLISCILFFQQITAQESRSISNLDNDWQFCKGMNGDEGVLTGKKMNWQPVQLPHTWNIEDVMDDEPGYYRGDGWYKRNIPVGKILKGKKYFLFFEGANQVTEVFVNRKKAGEHKGGYSGFYIPLSPFLKLGEDNELLVKVNNQYDSTIAPLTADFTFYGGIYRNVWLLALNDIHFSTQDFGSNAVYVTTPTVSHVKATVKLRAIVTNELAISRKIKLVTRIRNKAGLLIGQSSLDKTVLPGDNTEIHLPEITIRQPKLWSPQSPHLYNVTTEIIDVGARKVLDVVVNPLGLRWFNFDAAKGFFLNGKALKLVGTSRHQDYKDLGNALPDKLAVADLVLLKQMGGNFLRVAHYPQDPAVLAACDSLGILASVEIPIINEITSTESFFNNSAVMMKEMIRQCYNHPSVIIWCSMNEVLLRPRFQDNKEKQKTYFRSVTSLAKMLDSLSRVEDPSRFTMLAHHGDYNRYRETGLIDIPQIVGWNLYSGWYGPTLSDFPSFLDTFNKDYPLKPLVVSEYGADADPRIRSTMPTRFDKSVEYSTKFHQYYLTEMLKRPFVAGAMIWNLADFNSETRKESMPHINNKGLITWDRIPKDPYYYYKAMLSNKPFLKILGIVDGAGISDSGTTTCKRIVQVASNQKQLEMRVNNISYGIKKLSNGICEWNVPLRDGENVVEVKSVANKNLHSKAILNFVVYNSDLKQPGKFHPLNILLGARRFYTDESKQVWIPAREYRVGGWGYVGGKSFKIQGNSRLPYGTDKNIIGTVDDPVYQTQQCGIEKYILDVPVAEYELTLYFAELLGGIVKEVPYNLSEGDRIEPNGKRVFSVYVNDSLVLDHFDITASHGSASAVVKKYRVQANGNGIEIKFKAIEGEPVLNALQLKRVENLPAGQTD